MSKMMAPPKKTKKMTAPPKPKKKKKAKKKTAPKTPTGLPMPEPMAEFTPEHRDAFERMSKNCYEHLHRPRVVKILNWGEDIFYVCKECLDKYMEEHEELKKSVVSFGR